MIMACVCDLDRPILSIPNAFDGQSHAGTLGPTWQSTVMLHVPEFSEIAIIFVCLALGGMLKGAPGAGTPIIAVPALTMMFDVRFAVVLMLMPNLLPNVGQAWQYRHDRLPNRFVLSFALAGGVGVALGTYVLASISPDILSLFVIIGVFVYILIRLSKPDWVLSYPIAEKLSILVGILAGMLQGSSGLSAPASLTFLNAMRLERKHFISTISIFFAVMTFMQVLSLGMMDVLSWQGLLMSLLAIVPILLFMPVGAALAKQFSRQTFDRAILILLTALC